MTPIPEATSVTAIVVGGISSLITVLISKRLDGAAADRRQQAEERREEDREARRDFRRMRDQNAKLRSEVASYRAILISRGIPLPGDSE